MTAEDDGDQQGSVVFLGNPNTLVRFTCTCGA